MMLRPVSRAMVQVKSYLVRFGVKSVGELVGEKGKKKRSRLVVREGRCGDWR
jgi:hypothetical protein